MTGLEFQNLLQKWCQSDYNDSMGFAEIKRDMEFLARELYHEYNVTQHGGHGKFIDRLAKWIGSADTLVDQQNLFTILRHLIFLGDYELKASYRTAFSKHVLSWLMKLEQVNVFDPDAHAIMSNLVSKTLMTEITDSFGLRAFILANALQGQRDRYRWSSFDVNWDVNQFTQTNLKLGEAEERRFIVLFEDFVGSGSQIRKYVHRACSIGGNTQVLLCPMYICPSGANLARQWEAQYPHFTFSPVLEFPSECFIHRAQQADENSDYPRIRQTVSSIHNKVVGPNPVSQDYGPFGFDGANAIGEIGGFIVMSSNCPDNTLPAIHRRRANSWEPLFLRNSREQI